MAGELDNTIKTVQRRSVVEQLGPNSLAALQTQRQPSSSPRRQSQLRGRSQSNLARTLTPTSQASGSISVANTTAHQLSRRGSVSNSRNMLNIAAKIASGANHLYRTASLTQNQLSTFEESDSGSPIGSYSMQLRDDEDELDFDDLSPLENILEGSGSDTSAEDGEDGVSSSRRAARTQQVLKLASSLHGQERTAVMSDLHFSYERKKDHIDSEARKLDVLESACLARDREAEESIKDTIQKLEEKQASEVKVLATCSKTIEEYAAPAKELSEALLPEEARRRSWRDQLYASMAKVPFRRSTEAERRSDLESEHWSDGSQDSGEAERRDSRGEIRPEIAALLRRRDKMKNQPILSVEAEKQKKKVVAKLRRQATDIASLTKADKATEKMRDITDRVQWLLAQLAQEQIHAGQVLQAVNQVNEGRHALERGEEFSRHKNKVLEATVGYLASWTKEEPDAGVQMMLDELHEQIFGADRFARAMNGAIRYLEDQCNELEETLRQQERELKSLRENQVLFHRRLSHSAKSSNSGGSHADSVSGSKEETGLGEEQLLLLQESTRHNLDDMDGGEEEFLISPRVFWVEDSLALVQQVRSLEGQVAKKHNDVRKAELTLQSMDREATAHRHYYAQAEKGVGAMIEEIRSKASSPSHSSVGDDDAAEKRTIADVVMDIIMPKKTPRRTKKLKRYATGALAAQRRNQAASHATVHTATTAKEEQTAASNPRVSHADSAAGMSAAEALEIARRKRQTLAKSSRASLIKKKRKPPPLRSTVAAVQDSATRQSPRSMPTSPSSTTPQQQHPPSARSSTVAAARSRHATKEAAPNPEELPKERRRVSQAAEPKVVVDYDARINSEKEEQTRLRRDIAELEKAVQDLETSKRKREMQARGSTTGLSAKESSRGMTIVKVQRRQTQDLSHMEKTPTHKENAAAAATNSASTASAANTTPRGGAAMLADSANLASLVQQLNSSAMAEAAGHSTPPRRVSLGTLYQLNAQRELQGGSRSAGEPSGLRRSERRRHSLPAFSPTRGSLNVEEHVRQSQAINFDLPDAKPVSRGLMLRRNTNTRLHRLFSSRPGTVGGNQRSSTADAFPCNSQEWSLPAGFLPGTASNDGSHFWSLLGPRTSSVVSRWFHGPSEEFRESPEASLARELTSARDERQHLNDEIRTIASKIEQVQSAMRRGRYDLADALSSQIALIGPPEPPAELAEMKQKARMKQAEVRNLRRKWQRAHKELEVMLEERGLGGPGSQVPSRPVSRAAANKEMDAADLLGLSAVKESQSQLRLPPTRLPNQVMMQMRRVHSKSTADDGSAHPSPPPSAGEATPATKQINLSLNPGDSSVSLLVSGHKPMPVHAGVRILRNPAQAQKQA